MKPITRQQAEKLFDQAQVKTHKIEQSKKELTICIALDNDRSIFVVYDNKEHEEKYFFKGN